MNILIVTAHDAVNLSIENVVREFIRRGHNVAIFALRNEKRHIRMFEDLDIPIRPLSELNREKVKEFDCAFCPMDAVASLMFYDIYIFSYNFIFSSRWTTVGGDFMFMQTENRPILQWEDCARMAVGSPKNDTPPLNEDTPKNTMLFVDTGHYPFGETGKLQVANMLLSICKKFPSYKVVVKPRWLPNESNNIHANRIHLYNMISEICSSKIPENLILLDEHLDMQNLIDQSIVVITPGSSAYLEAAMRGKNVLIVTGLTSENCYEVRTDTVWREQFQVFAGSGCLVDYREIEHYLPYGLTCHKEHLKKLGVSNKNVSEKIADVVEDIFSRFLSQGLFPAIEQYSLITYMSDIKADPDLTYSELKRKRMKNRVLVLSRSFDSVVADIDYTEWLDALDEAYQTCPINKNGLDKLWRIMRQRLNDIWLSEADKMMADPIDQSILLQTLYDTGNIDQLLTISPKDILCEAPYHYYLGMIYKSRKRPLAAIEHFCFFLKEANCRSHNQYPQEADWGIRNSYNFIFDIYDGENIDPTEFADLYIALYEQRNVNIVAYKSRKRAHNLLLKTVKKLQEIDPNRAYKCLQLYARGEYHYNIRERDNTIKRLKKDIANIRGAKMYRLNQKFRWFISKLRGGIRCLREHGWRYTIHRTGEHISNHIKGKEPWKIYKVFSEQILEGYKVYSEIVSNSGDDTFIHIAAGGNGDVYLVLQYYTAYINRSFSDKKNVLVSESSSFSSLIDWWNISRAKQLSSDQWRCMICLYMFATNVNIEILHPHIFIRRTGILSYLEGIHGLNFMKLQESVLFDGLSPSKPPLTNDTSELERVFEEHGLVVGKTVVLSPYARSLPPVPQAYWIKLAQKLNDMGWTVCTNAVGSQLPILGTEKIELPFCLMEQFFNMAGYLVSLRSGTDDITHNSSCRRVEVYAEKTIRRSLVASAIECFQYLEHPVIVTIDKIDICIEETIFQLGLCEVIGTDTDQKNVEDELRPERLRLGGYSDGVQNM